MTNRWGTWLHEAFGLDLRTLALARVGFALLILIDLVVRFDGLIAHYTDHGLYPRSLYFLSGFPTTLSLYSLVGEGWMVGGLFALNAVAAVALLTGWRTTAATILCWFFLHSLQNRNFLLLNGGDTWLRMMLFWSMFLPLGARWSIDSMIARVAEKGVPEADNEFPNSRCDLASLAFVSQVFLVYLFAGLYKTGPAWWDDFTAVQMTMMAHEWTGELAYYLLFYPELMAKLTASVLLLELVGPWLFFSPIATGAVRTVIVWSFFFFHVGLYLFMELGLFPAVGMVSVLSLLPAWFWERTPASRIADSLDRLQARLKVPRFFLHSKAAPRPSLGNGSKFLIFLSFMMVLSWNLDRAFEEKLLSPSARQAIRIARLDQYWGLFAPNAPESHSWFVAVGTLKDGSKVDLFRNGAPLDWSVPSSSAVYPNQRTKRMLVTLSTERMNSIRAPLAEFYFRDWHKRLPDLRIVEVYRLYRDSDYRDIPPHKQLYSKFSQPA